MARQEARALGHFLPTSQGPPGTPGSSNIVFILPKMDLLRVGDGDKPTRYALSLWYAPGTVLCRCHLFNPKGDFSIPPPRVVYGHTGDVSMAASDSGYAAVVIYFVSNTPVQYFTPAQVIHGNGPCRQSDP